MLNGTGLVADNWYRAKTTASLTLQNPSQSTYVLGYVCTWTGTEWKYA
jgi:hypothetical protein